MNILFLLLFATSAQAGTLVTGAEISTSVIVGTQISNTFSAVTSSTLTVTLSTGIYELTWMLDYTTDGNLGLRFNGDGGANYKYGVYTLNSNNGAASNGGNVQKWIGLTEDSIYVDAAGWASGTAKIYVFNTGSNGVSVTHESTDYANTHYVRRSWGGGSWTGSNFPTSITIFSPVVGAWTGYINFRKVE